MDELQKALQDVRVANAKIANLKQENAELVAARDELRRDVADRNGQVLELQTRIETLDRERREAVDALLACEIEKAVHERRLLEIRLADLRGEEEEGQR
jgi:hypothetical protein